MDESTSETQLTRRFLKKRLQRDVVTFRGHASEWQNIHDLIKRSADLSESNSLLLIGPRGSGKTTLINSVLYTLLQDIQFAKNTIIVYLNGLLHTDDKLALKAATVQLNLENAVDGKVFGSFAENLSFLLSCLRSGNKQSKSVIFLLEEFDLFCNHHNQTLLYNLFDISQSAQAPICVLGITCRLDVIELLEKRVKSRYSHRQIFLYPESNNFNERLELFKHLLTLPTHKQIRKAQMLKPNLQHLQISNHCFLRNIFDLSEYEFSKMYVQNWNNHIDKLTASLEVKKCLQGMYDLDTNEDYFKKFLYRLVSKLKDSHMMLTEEDVMALYLLYRPETDAKINLLHGLSVLELCLVIAMKHYTEIYDGDPFNFEIIFGRFGKFARASTTMQGIERAVVLKAYEHLKNLEFILPLNCTSSSGKIQKEFQMHRMALTSSQINQTITSYRALPTEVSQWSQSELF